MALNKVGWEQKIRQLCIDGANIFWTEHAKQQMRKRAITMPVALEVLRKGTVKKEPEPDIKTGHTKCRMELYCAGKLITVVVALETEATTDCIIVTAFTNGD